MKDYIRLIVYKIIYRPSLWCGRFITHEQVRERETLLRKEMRDILMNEEKTKFFRQKEIMRENHWKEMERAFFSHTKR